MVIRCNDVQLTLDHRKMTSVCGLSKMAPTSVLARCDQARRVHENWFMFLLEVVIKTGFEKANWTVQWNVCIILKSSPSLYSAISDGRKLWSTSTTTRQGRRRRHDEGEKGKLQSQGQRIVSDMESQDYCPTRQQQNNSVWIIRFVEIALVAAFQ